MQYFLTSGMLMLMANSAFASGLSEPKVLQPVLGVTASCDQEFTATRLDYIGATAHFVHAIGQSKSQHMLQHGSKLVTQKLRQ